MINRLIDTIAATCLVVMTYTHLSGHWLQLWATVTLMIICFWLCGLLSEWRGSRFLRFYKERCLEAKEIVRDYNTKVGHDACWYYGELFEELCDVFNLPCNKPTITRIEFEEGCRRYQNELYGEKCT